MNPTGPFQNRLILKGGSHKSQARRQAICPESGRDRATAKIEQVHEVGVTAEIGVQANGVFGNVLPGIDGPRRWESQKIKVLPNRVGLAAILRQAVLRFESIQSRRFFSFPNHRQSFWLKRLRRLLDQRVSGQVPFRNPRSLIEELGSFQKRAHIKNFQIQTGSAENLDTFIVGILRQSIAEEFKLFGR